VLAYIFCVLGVGQASAADGVWTPIDVKAFPPNGGSWERAYLDPANPGRILVGAEDGLYRSVDRGASWSRVVTLETGLYPVEVRFDPNDARIAYATTDVVRG
jgi:hypothetical protein